MEDIFLVAGLGNPGSDYEKTRHNIGFRAIDVLSAKTGIKVKKLKYNCVFGEGYIGNNKVILLKPLTFMNRSGECIREMANWLRISYNNIIAVYDDADIPFGTIRVRKSGSAGTHNGMRSVLHQLVTEDFPRVRLGIDRPPEEVDIKDYVLSRFSLAEDKALHAILESAADAIIAIITDGAEKAMALYNKKHKYIT